MVLYISVFGESILNDGVAVVLYQVFESFLEIGDEAITFVNLWRAVIKFSIVAGGGTLMGCVFGYLGSFVFKVRTCCSTNMCGRKIFKKGNLRQRRSSECWSRCSFL